MAMREQFRGLGRIVLMLALAAGLHAGAPAAALAADPPANAAMASYVLGPDDVVEVSVLGRTDFTTRGRIAADGTIQLPYLGVVAAAKQTGREFADSVARSLEAGGYFAKPIVKVDIVSYASRYIVVLGDVKSPGLVPIDRGYRLSEIIARVGGVAEGGADYVVLRSEGSGERRFKIAELATGDASQDPYVSAGDKVYVPHAELFFISGQVKGPGAFALTSGMTLRMAIGRAGGLTDAGSEGHIKVTRQGKVIPRMKLDDPLIAGDVIVVGEGLF